MTIIAVCGLLREARIAAGPGVTALAGDAATLRKKLDAAFASGARGIISFGIAGGLAPFLKPGDCVIANEIIANGERYPTDEAWRARMIVRLPNTIAAPIAGLDAIVAAKAAKADLQRATGAYAADMESHIAAEFARARHLPFAVLRAISDPWNSELPPLAANALNPDGGVNLAAVLGSLLKKPAQIPALMRTSRESNAAFAALLRCRRALGLRLLGPD